MRIMLHERGKGFMNQERWIKHISCRSDFTSRVTHLTRRTDEKTAFEVLCNILDSKTIIASDSSGYIRNGTRAVCFQDVPLHSLAENIRYEDEHRGFHTQSNKEKIRYEAFGLRFNKGNLFAKGGRPVIYGTDEELDNMPENEQWRCVKIDIRNPENIIDWAHEREWRLKGDLHFEYNEIDVIVGCEKYYKELIGRYSNSNFLSEINGIIVLNSQCR